MRRESQQAPLQGQGERDHAVVRPGGSPGPGSIAGIHGDGRPGRPGDREPQAVARTQLHGKGLQVHLPPPCFLGVRPEDAGKACTQLPHVAAHRRQQGKGHTEIEARLIGLNRDLQPGATQQGQTPRQRRGAETGHIGAMV